jgi:hypothetical protein
VASAPVCNPSIVPNIASGGCMRLKHDRTFDRSAAEAPLAALRRPKVGASVSPMHHVARPARTDARRSEIFSKSPARSSRSGRGRHARTTVYRVDSNSACRTGNPCRAVLARAFFRNPACCAFPNGYGHRHSAVGRPGRITPTWSGSARGDLRTIGDASRSACVGARCILRCPVFPGSFESQPSRRRSHTGCTWALVGAGHGRCGELAVRSQKERANCGTASRRQPASRRRLGRG